MIHALIAAAILAQMPAPGGINWGVIIALCVFVLNTITAVVGLALGIAKIREMTALLAQAMEHLKSAISGLDQSVRKIADTTHEHGERLAALEAKQQ